MTTDAAPSNPFANADLDLAPATVAEQLAAGSITLIDIREPHEREVSAIPGAAHLPIDRVAWNAHTLDWSRPVVFHCRLGWRAGMVAHAFHAIGRRAFNLDGGMLAWHEAGLPVEPNGALVAEH
jgi:rhodanese-related sulfurtransferase